MLCHVWVFCEPFNHLTTLCSFHISECMQTSSSKDTDAFKVSTDSACLWTCVFVFVSATLLTLSLYFIRAPSPDNCPGLELDLKCPSLWPLRLLRIKQCQYCPQLQVSVQVVHLCVVVHPRARSVGKEARGPSHVHFPCLLSVSSQNNLLSPGLDRDTYSRRRRRGNPWNNNSPRASSVSVLHTHYTAVRSWCCQETCFKNTENFTVYMFIYLQICCPQCMTE